MINAVTPLDYDQRKKHPSIEFRAWIFNLLRPLKIYRLITHPHPTFNWFGNLSHGMNEQLYPTHPLMHYGAIDIPHHGFR